MCKVCNNRGLNCPACVSDVNVERYYNLDFAFEVDGMDVNVIGHCTVSMNECKIIELVGEAYLTDETGERVKELRIENFKNYVWSALFGNFEMVYNENKYSEYEN